MRLRLHDAGDAPAIVETSNDPVAVEWTTVPQPYGDGEAQWWVGHMHAGWEKRAAGDESGVMGWAVDVRDEAGEWTFAGQVEVRPIGGGVGELGLVLHPAARGRGLMVEAGRLAMRWATTTGGLDTLHWRTAVGNWASRRLAWRLGFTVGQERWWMHQRGALVPAWHGSLTRDEELAEQVRKADRAIDELDLRSWVDTMPHGLATPVGQRGESLSAGERQLVALLRARLADPDLLVLDEATSAVDPGTELRIARALRSLTRGRTSIAIAHRLSTAEAADTVVVMDGGVVVEQGPHADLVGRGGRYSALHASWASQQRHN